jgi:hypothetical protein
MRCIAVAWLAGLFGLMAGCSGSRAGDDGGVAAAGDRLWRGERPLVARIAGHASPLPPQAARCINCHGSSDTPRREGALPPETRPIPTLTAAHLRQAVSRRGGPPTRYDAGSFCQVLRRGIDPAAVLLPRTMPRYDLDEADCKALWQHLTTKDTRP